MAVALVAHAVLAVGPVVRKQTQNRVGTARDVAVMPAGQKFDILSDRKP
jgi:hypothetical protein